MKQTIYKLMSSITSNITDLVIASSIDETILSQFANRRFYIFRSARSKISSII